eukprot:7225755-Alexandrium_andersonii.AAC.1
MGILLAALRDGAEKGGGGSACLLKGLRACHHLPGALDVLPGSASADDVLRRESLEGKSGGRPFAVAQ